MSILATTLHAYYVCDMVGIWAIVPMEYSIMALNEKDKVHTRPEVEALQNLATAFAKAMAGIPFLQEIESLKQKFESAYADLEDLEEKVKKFVTSVAEAGKAVK